MSRYLKSFKSCKMFEKGGNETFYLPTISGSSCRRDTWRYISSLNCEREAILRSFLPLFSSPASVSFVFCPLKVPHNVQSMCPVTTLKIIISNCYENLNNKTGQKILHVPYNRWSRNEKVSVQTLAFATTSPNVLFVK